MMVKTIIATITISNVNERLIEYPIADEFATAP